MIFTPASLTGYLMLDRRTSVKYEIVQWLYLMGQRRIQILHVYDAIAIPDVIGPEF